MTMRNDNDLSVPRAASAARVASMFGGAGARGAKTCALLRVVVALLIACVASGGALPSWAQIAQGPGAHVCQCSVEHHDCLCARCHADDPSLWTSSESIKGNCGTRAELLGPTAMKAVVFEAASVAAAGLVDELTFSPPPALSDTPRAPPPTPPPRRA